MQKSTQFFSRIVESVSMTDLGAEVFRSIQMLSQALKPAVPEPLNNNLIYQNKVTPQIAECVYT